MAQLVAEPLTPATGPSWEACGVLVDPSDIVGGMADALQRVLADLDGYERLAVNARGRVEDFFQLHEAMGMYNRVYRRLGGLPPRLDQVAAGGGAEMREGTRDEVLPSRPLAAGTAQTAPR